MRVCRQWLRLFKAMFLNPYSKIAFLGRHDTIVVWATLSSMLML